MCEMCKIVVKNIIDEDFVNFKAPAMFVAFPACTFKCGRENCQNRELAAAPDIHIAPEKIAARYAANPISEAVVLGGLDPLDSPDAALRLVHALRKVTNDPVVIYTGYDKENLGDVLELLSFYKNIIVKFGKFVPGQKPHFDPTLGVMLASDNQYAETIRGKE